MRLRPRGRVGGVTSCYDGFVGSLDFSMMTPRTVLDLSFPMPVELLCVGIEAVRWQTSLLGPQLLGWSVNPAGLVPLFALLIAGFGATKKTTRQVHFRMNRRVRFVREVDRR